MHQFRFKLETSDLDFIKKWIAEGSFDAAAHFLERPYIAELITREQQDEMDFLKLAFQNAVSQSKLSTT